MAKIGDNIYWQEKGEGLFETINAKDVSTRNRLIKFMHVLNLYQPTGIDGLGMIQESVLDSMLVAKSLYDATTGSSSVDFISVQTPDDNPLVPKYFKNTFNLNRDVTDVVNFTRSYKLPILSDLLCLADNSSSTADTIIFTNSDICLTPSFYNVVGTLINRGFDSLIINRRTIFGFEPDDLGMVAVADLGEIHPGLDCFVFPRSWIDNFTHTTSCVGAGQVMRSLLINMICQAKSLLVLTESHLTYHYGDDRKWLGADMKEYEAHNIEQASMVYKELTKIPKNKSKLNTFFNEHPKYRPKSN